MGEALDLLRVFNPRLLAAVALVHPQAAARPMIEEFVYELSLSGALPAGDFNRVVALVCLWSVDGHARAPNRREHSSVSLSPMTCQGPRGDGEKIPP